MKSNYKKVGDFIRLVKEKNRESLYSELLGINIDKFFMPSVANIHGVDLSAYKVVRKNQFACNRMHVGRDYRIPISLSHRDEPFLVSPAYDVFEIKDTSILLPEYLMMWFSRKEFDRNAWFYTDADVRGGLPWSSFCEIELPIPSIEKQLVIVREYNTIVNRISLNEQMIKKMEETAHAIYKRWFVEFEFPDENGIPYNSSGGKMVWCEELEKEIPEGWEVVNLESLGLDISDGNYSSKYPKSRDFLTTGVPFIRGTNFRHKVINPNGLYYISPKQHAELRKGHTKSGDILMATRGEIGKIAFVTKDFIGCNINAQLVRINGGKKYSTFYLGCLFESNDYKEELLASTTGSALLQLPRKNLSATRFLQPTLNLVKEFSERYSILYFSFIIHNEVLFKLEALLDLLLSKMTKVEETTEKEMI